MPLQPRVLLVCAALSLCSVVTDTNAAAASAVSIDPASYPALDDKELGHIRRMVKLSRQLPGDWSGMGDDVYHAAERTRQFQLSYMAAALGLVQHQYTPAYRELYRPAMDALIQKMTLPDIWETWLASSRGGTSAYNGVPADPQARDLVEGWTDPVRKYNVMLKGYLLQAGALYEMLYRDGRYRKPDAFTFRYVPGTWGNGTVVFRYSLPDLARIVHQEFVDAHYEGVLCEPNRFFPQCNQPPILGLINYDQIYGTSYAADVMPKFKAAWLRKGYTNPQTQQNIGYLLVRQNQSGGGGGPDGWNGPWMNAWDPQFVQSMFAVQRPRFLDVFLSGQYARNVPEFAGKDLLSLGYGLFAFWSAEMGDQEARRRLLEYADRNFNPVWEEGAYYYPYNQDYSPDAQGNSHGVSTWTGNVLLALARLDKGGGFLKLYREPWSAAQLQAPQITDVDYLGTNVSQAYYDARRAALIVTLKPGPVKAARSGFVVRNLDPARTYTVVKDGQVLGQLSRDHGQAGADVSRRSDGAVAVRTGLERPHSFVFAAN